MSDVPYARERLTDLAETLRSVGGTGTDWIADEIDEVVREQLFRERPIYPRTRAKSRRIGEAEAEAIRALKRRRPDMSHHEIANEFQSGIGRVSESLTGKR